jgi:enoyl-CoA hydratase
MPVTTTMDGSVLLLGLAMPRGNAINFAFIDALSAALDEAERAAPGAVVLTGQGRAFCAGLDLVEAYEYDRPTLRRFVEAFDDLFLRVFGWPQPIVAAVNGHAIAGGCILAMAADLRVVAPGEYGIAINEVELGIPFPSGAFEVARFALPRHAWPEWFMVGRRFSPAEALAAHLAHEMAAEGGAVARATERARELAARPADAVRAIKADLRAQALERARRAAPDSRARFVDAWYAPPAREKIGAVRDGLLRKKSG